MGMYTGLRAKVVVLPKYRKAISVLHINSDFFSHNDRSNTPPKPFRLWDGDCCGNAWRRSCNKASLIRKDFS